MVKATINNEAFTPTPICTVVGQVRAEENPIYRQISNSSAVCKLVWGFTLVEALLALVILTIAAAGLLLPFASSAAVQQQGCNQTIAAKLACDRVEQIISDTNYWPAGSYNEQRGQVKDANGIIFNDPMYADFSREAVCEYVYMPPQQSFGMPNFIKITVRVYQNDLKLAEVVRLKSK